MVEPFGLTSLISGIVVASILAIYGWRKRSLSPSGAIAAWVVGFLSVSCGLRGYIIIIFYQIGTKATKYKKAVKATMDSDAAESAVRGMSQVLACSIIAVCCALVHAWFYGAERSIDFKASWNESCLACAIVSHYATCLGDTLASEIGMLSKSQPIFFWSLRKVPAGTNGGASVLGTAMSVIGGALIGIGAIILDMLSGLETRPIAMILFSSSCGFVGSLLDSILGATVQVTYYDVDRKVVVSSKGKDSNTSNIKHISGYDILSNAQVNVVSVLITSILGGVLLGPFFFN